LSSTVAALKKEHVITFPYIEIICYRESCKGLFVGDSFGVPHGAMRPAEILYQFASIPRANNRATLKNAGICIKREFVKDGKIPLNVAAE
jgi:hypothetical protein